MPTPNLKTIPVEEGHIERVASRMRECDAAEVLASSGLEPLPALQQSVKVSTYARSFVNQDGAFAIFGVGASNLFSRVGYPWLLGTDEVADHPKWFLRETKRELQELLKRHHFLENWVDARNVTSIRWLEWLGFDVQDPAPYGAASLPFHHFELRG